MVQLLVKVLDTPYDRIVVNSTGKVKQKSLVVSIAIIDKAKNLVYYKYKIFKNNLF